MINTYVQQKWKNKYMFGKDYSNFIINSFEEIILDDKKIKDDVVSIQKLLEAEAVTAAKEKGEPVDTFQPIINFPNFLLIVLKITRILEEKDFNPTAFNLDDKELILEFDALDDKLVGKFAYNLLKAKYFLDNYIVHHSNEDDVEGNNPWMLKKWQKEGKPDTVRT